MQFKKVAQAAISDAEKFAGNDYVAHRWLSRAKFWAFTAVEFDDNQSWRFALMRAICSLESSIGKKSPTTVLYTTWYEKRVRAGK